MPRCVSVNRILLMTFYVLLAASPVYANTHHKPKAASRENREAILRHILRAEINAGLVGIVSEGTDYTADLALSFAGDKNLRLLPIAGAGALQNAKDVLFARGIDFSIVQTDVLDEIKRNPPFPEVEKYLQYITKLYNEELHILAGPDIQSIEDLRGKKVNFGLRNSGTATTAATIFKSLGIEPDVTNLSQPLALDKLRRGEISALVYLATKPSRLFQDIRPEENLRFLPIIGNLPSTYVITTITSDDYPELVSKNAPVRTIAVGTALVVYNWPLKTEHHRRVTRFVQAFFAHLNDIKARRPKWRDFDVTASVPGWVRFPAATQWLKKAELTPEVGKEFAQEQFPLSPKKPDALLLKFAARHITEKAERKTGHFNPKQHKRLFRGSVEFNNHHQTVSAYHGTAAEH